MDSTHSVSLAVAAKLMTCCYILITPLTYIVSTLFQSSVLLFGGFKRSGGAVKLHADEDTLFPYPGKITPYEKSRNQNATPCGTSVSSAYIPRKNEQGELEFKLANKDNGNSSEDDTYPTSTPETKYDYKVGKEDPDVSNPKNGFISLSPVSSIRSEGSGIVSDQHSNEVTDSQDDNNLQDPEDIEGTENGADSERVHQCPECDSKFRIRGYLTRHMKKHSKSKAYRCPFHGLYGESKCHQTGEFSRRDTFKTHLKARHFKYPPGIKCKKRTGMMGWCGICGEKFLNNEIWVERHIETGLCPGLPEDYIKTLKPGKKKTGKHSKFLDVDYLSENTPLATSQSPSFIPMVTEFSSFPHYENLSQLNNLNNLGNIPFQTRYLQSPSSVDSSPPSLNNSKPNIANQRCLTIPTPCDSTQPTRSLSPDTPVNVTPSNVDLETLTLLQKQQELIQIINSLKQKQLESEMMRQQQHQQQQQQQQQQTGLQETIVQQNSTNFPLKGDFSGLNEFLKSFSAENVHKQKRQDMKQFVFQHMQYKKGNEATPGGATVSNQSAYTNIAKPMVTPFHKVPERDHYQELMDNDFPSLDEGF
ncbi:Transcription factor STP2 [Pichia kudriavzevii]|uniref:Transcription factor STP2 n=1 Tax=Pichia kudriavzevii TaxID=4909 RepID=A0A1V2LU55_PICKU|nr:Transcription factor STP2 [Pichia kudriavzevii]